MQKSASTAELCAIGVLEQGSETLDEVDYRLMFSEPPSTDSDIFGSSYHSLPRMNERYVAGVGVGGVSGGESLRTSTSPDRTRKVPPRNMSSESIRSDITGGASDRLNRYTRRGVGGGGMFRNGVDGVNGVQDGESTLKAGISSDRNVSPDSIQSDTVGTSDRLQLYARRGSIGGGRIFGNGVEGVNGAQDRMGKLRHSNSNVNQSTGNGTSISNSVSMPHSLDTYFNLYACHAVKGDEISPSSAQNGTTVLTANASQEPVSGPYGGGSSKVGSSISPISIPSGPPVQSLPRPQSSSFPALTKANPSSISQTLSDTDLLGNFAKLAVDRGTRVIDSKTTITQAAHPWQPPSMESVVGYEIDTPVPSPNNTPPHAPCQSPSDESPHQFHLPAQQPQYQQQHHPYHYHPYHHQPEQQHSFNQYHKDISAAHHTQGLGENGFGSHLAPDAMGVHSLEVNEFLPGLPPHLANDSVALYNALLVQQSMSMAAMNQRRLHTYMAPGNMDRSTAAMALAQAQPPQASLSNAFHPQHPGAKNPAAAYQNHTRNGFYRSRLPTMGVRGGSMVGRAGGHGASNPVGLPGTIHNPHNPPVQYTPATDTDIYKVRFKRGVRTFYLGQRAETDLRHGDHVKVEADRGEDLGVIASILPDVQGFQFPGVKREFIIRRATREEMAMLNDKLADEAKVLELCRAQARQRMLPMEIIDAEYQFDRNKLTFFFRAEGRVDFRELVRDLFAIYKTRIWMQQVDEQRNVSYSTPDMDMSGANWLH